MIHHRTTAGWNCLHLAAERGSPALIQLLASVAAAFDGGQLLLDDVPGGTGPTGGPLHLAAKRGVGEIAVILLAAGASVGLQDANSESALHHAASASTASYKSSSHCDLPS